MSGIKFQAITWESTDEKWCSVFPEADDDIDIMKSVIYGFGMYKTSDNSIKDILIKINDFNPWIYVEPPKTMTNDWTVSGYQQELLRIVKTRLYKHAQNIKSMEFVWRTKLYYANYKKDSDNSYKEIKFPYIKIYVYSDAARQHIARYLACSYSVNGYSKYGPLAFKVHEANATPLLQFVSIRHINMSNWNIVMGKKDKSYSYDFTDKISYDETIEIKTSYQNVKGIEHNDWINPRIMSEDIECYSSIKGSMPLESRPTDCVFQISCVCLDHDLKKTKYLLSYSPSGNHPTQFDDDVIILNYNSEQNLLNGHRDLKHKFRPHVITGWNTMGFDMKYEYNRVKSYYSLSYDYYCQQGVLLDRKDEFKTVEWTSSAYHARKYQFFDSHGRVHIDLMAEVQRNFKFDSYTLDNVSSELLNDKKEDVSAAKMFKLFEAGESDGLGTIGKYCVQDSDLVARMFQKLNMWHQISIMSTVCRVRPTDLVTRGQQLKVFSQVYDYCVNHDRVVEKDAYIVKDDEAYSGAFVFPPVPGLYDDVLPFDFASLYPSIIIAYNICFSTLVLDESIPDDMCHVIAWTEHSGCEHDTTIRKTKKKNVICGDFKYRFLKSPVGVLPSKLIALLAERKTVRNKMKPLEDILQKIKSKQIELSDKEIFDTQTQYNVLDAQQLAIKISSNSVYGSLGVRKGSLPFMPGAMCTTAKGRESVILASTLLKSKFGADIVYGDTDSCMIRFPHLSKPEEIWDNALAVQTQLKEFFPPPMCMEFEKLNYKRYLIFTKKRYLIIACGRDGVLFDKVKKKGVLSVRRGNCKYVRQLYDDIGYMTLMGDNTQSIVDYAVEKVLAICYRQVDISQLTVTVSLNSFADYKRRKLNDDPKKREEQLRKKHVSTEEEFALKSLPGHVQLAYRMRERGEIVDEGSRISYIVLRSDDLKASKSERLEDPLYFIKYGSVLRIDYESYIKQLMNGFDEMSIVAWKRGKIFENMYNQMINKRKLNLQICKYSQRKVQYDLY